VLDTYWVAQLGSAALAALTISLSIRWVLNSLANGLFFIFWCRRGKWKEREV
jgi:Na+-driven multidrug efflux pump